MKMYGRVEGKLHASLTSAIFTRVIFTVDLPIASLIEVRVEVFWGVTPCSVVVGYQRFGGPWCLHLQASALKFSLVRNSNF
jgi:hypothetical protein